MRPSCTCCGQGSTVTVLVTHPSEVMPWNEHLCAECRDAVEDDIARGSLYSTIVVA